MLGASPAELEALLGRSASPIAPGISGRVRVLGVARGGPDRIRCEVMAERLIPVDPASPVLGDVMVAVPVRGSVELDAQGSLAGAAIADPSAEEIGEARAYALTLIETGAVRGLSHGRTGGPPPRPTHEVEAAPAGARVIRRIGYQSR